MTTRLLISIALALVACVAPVESVDASEKFLGPLRAVMERHGFPADSAPLRSAREALEGGEADRPEPEQARGSDEEGTNSIGARERPVVPLHDIYGRDAAVLKELAALGIVRSAEGSDSQ